MPTLLMKTGRAFLALARKSHPVFLPLKTAPPTWRRCGFSSQSEGRHNTLDFASGKVCAKGLRPLWIPRRDCPAFAPQPVKAAGFNWLTRSLWAIQKPPNVLAPAQTFGGFYGDGGIGGRMAKSCRTAMMDCSLRFQWLNEIIITNPFASAA